jgi:RNA polymerase sigma factor (sigma-70 family)
MPSTTGTGGIAGTASARRGQTDEYREQLEKIKGRIQELTAKREQAEGMERVRLDYDIQMLKEMRRDLRAAKKMCAAQGAKVKRVSLNNTANGAGQLADFLASQVTASLEESRESGEAVRWLKEVLQDALTFETEENREILQLHFLEGMTRREIAARLGKSPSAISRRLQRSVARLKKYTADRARLRRELQGDVIDPERLLADLQCYERAPRQRQVMGLFFSGMANYEIAVDLGLRPCHISRTRKRGAEKLEVMGEDALTLMERTRHGRRALLGAWKIERYGPNHQKESGEKYETTNPHGPGWAEKGA